MQEWNFRTAIVWLQSQLLEYCQCKLQDKGFKYIKLKKQTRPNETKMQRLLICLLSGGADMNLFSFITYTTYKGKTLLLLCRRKRTENSQRYTVAN
jgi:hypothetical protein